MHNTIVQKRFKEQNMETVQSV